MLLRFFRSPKRSFTSLSEQEILAVAIASEEDDARIYLAYADTLRAELSRFRQGVRGHGRGRRYARKTLIDMHRRAFR